MAQIFIIIALALLGGGAYYYTQEYKPARDESAMQDDHDHAAEGAIMYDLLVDGKVVGSSTFLPNESLELEVDGTVYYLNQVPMASGIRYESNDGSVVYMEHQGNITIEASDTTYTEVAAVTVSGATDGNAAGETSQPADGESGVVVYGVVENGDEVATVVFNGEFVEVEIDGEVYRLDQVTAEVNGTMQYESADGTVVFVEGDNYVNLEQNGVVVAEEAMLEITDRDTTPAFDAMLRVN